MKPRNSLGREIGELQSSSLTRGQRQSAVVSSGDPRCALHRIPPTLPRRGNRAGALTPQLGPRHQDGQQRLRLEERRYHPRHPSYHQSLPPIVAAAGVFHRIRLRKSAPDEVFAPYNRWSVTAQLCRSANETAREGKCSSGRTGSRSVRACSRNLSTVFATTWICWVGSLNRDLGHWLDVETPSASSEPHRRMVAAE